MHNAHVTFFCSGGKCKVLQCIHCKVLLNQSRGLVENPRCIHCGMLKDLCVCQGYRYAERMDNSS